MSVTTNNTYLKQYIEASSLGAARGLIGLPIEHPFDIIKTRCQATGGKKSTLAVTKELWNKGISSFYSGAIPNATRVMIKQAYRWPLMLALPPLYTNTLPKSLTTQYSTLPKAMTGLSIAIVEVGVLTPLERLKVHLMTSLQKGKGIRQFLSENRGKLGQEMTRGLNATFARQISSWVSFLVADEKFKQWERKRTHTKELSFPSLMGVSIMVGLVNTAANMPWDALKTHLTKVDYIPNEGILTTLKKTYQHYGMKGLYTGWQVRMLQYTIQSVFTVNLLDKLERSWKTAQKHS